GTLVRHSRQAGRRRCLTPVVDLRRSTPMPPSPTPTLSRQTLDPPGAGLQILEMTTQASIVTEDEADIRLDRWFRRHFPGVTQAAIQELCRTGQVRVDGHRAEAATRLAAGQSVRVPPLPAAPVARPPPEIDEHTA